MRVVVETLIHAPRPRVFDLARDVEAHVIRSYFQLDATTFQTDLLALGQGVLDSAGVREFFIPGQSHTMLGSPAHFSQNGVALLEFLRLQVSDDAAWSSEKP